MRQHSEGVVMGGGAGGAEGTHTQGGEEVREVAGEGGRGDYLRE